MGYLGYLYTNDRAIGYKMSRYDLILVHAPSVYDFRKRGLMFGPIADLIPSTPVFEMYPIGFTTIASHLSHCGYRVRILNLAAHMLADRSFDVERAIRKADSSVFGVDLHWLPHAHGSLEIAKLIKKYHPDSKVVMGGFSSTYYHKEILREHEYVDAVFLGDSTELPMVEFMRSIEAGASFDAVRNISFRENGRIRSNGITHIVKDLDEVDFDYGLVVRSVMRSLDLTGHLPYIRWKDNPMLLVDTVRGCSNACTTCMGSCGSFNRNFGRRSPAFRSPEKILEDIRQIESYFRGAIFISGDIQQPGNAYAERLLSLLRKERIRNEISFEFFNPPNGGLASQIGRSIEVFNVQISPDSHDPAVRSKQGRNYSNEELEKSIGQLLQAGTRRVDIFFMIGLPGQDPASVADTVKFCDGLLARQRAGKRLLPFISPLAPFIDPGSDAFESPEIHGYTIFARTLAEHRALLLRPSWKHVLNYETKWLDRDQIVESTYDAGLGMNDIKERAGAITSESAANTRERIVLAREAMHRIDGALLSDDPETSLSSVFEEVRELSESTVCNKSELDWTSRSIYWSFPRAIFSAVRGR